MADKFWILNRMEGQKHGNIEERVDRYKPIYTLLVLFIAAHSKFSSRFSKGYSYIIRRNDLTSSGGIGAIEKLFTPGMSLAVITLTTPGIFYRRKSIIIALNIETPHILTLLVPNPFMPNGLFYHYKFISNLRVVWLLLVKEIPVSKINSVDPDQTPRSAASDLGLHCLPMSFFGYARLKWVKFGQVHFTTCCCV